MVVVRKVNELRILQNSKFKGRTMGFVPTMGDLHLGHLSLIRRSKKENDHTAVSIFVNPTQFNQKHDFMMYRRNETRDLQLLKDEGVDLTFLPKYQEMYPEGFQSWIEVEKLTQGLCGPHRPGHFRAVATVVAKLFNLIKPNQAYFGEKDYQQFKVIERMVKDLDIPVHVISCPTVREKDGLAMSSRNQRLNPLERIRAARIFPALQSVAQRIRSKKFSSLKALRDRFLSVSNLKNRDLEYLEIVHSETLVPLKNIKPPLRIACAVWIGRTRLIDSV